MPNQIPYTAELGTRIANEYATGKAWAEVTALDGVPTLPIIIAWERRHHEFEELMITARQAHAEALIEQMRDIADNTKDPQKARVQIETRRFIASKFSPRFADRVEVKVEQNVSIVAALDAADARLRRMHDGITIDAQSSPGGIDWSDPSLPPHLQSAPASEADLPDFMQ